MGPRRNRDVRIRHVDYRSKVKGLCLRKDSTRRTPSYSDPQVVGLYVENGEFWRCSDGPRTSHELLVLREGSFRTKASFFLVSR